MKKNKVFRKFSAFFIPLLVSLVSLPSWADEAKLDGASLNKFFESSVAATKEMPDEKRNIFIAAVEFFISNTVKLDEAFAYSAGTLGKEELQAKRVSELNGLTVNEVVKLAKSIAESKLEKSGAANEASSIDDASKVEISNVSSKKLKDRAFGEKIEIKFTVKNGTNQPISKLAFLAIAKTEGRTIPWHTDDDLTVEIPGGIEPNESMKLTIEPNPFGWPIKDIPADAKITMELNGLYGEGTKLLWTSKPPKDGVSVEEIESFKKMISDADNFLK